MFSCLTLGFAPKLPTEAGVLNYVGECDDTSGPCGECEGDCDSDDDCGTGLSCYKRDALEAVPGCSGGSEFDIPGMVLRSMLCLLYFIFS